MSDGAPLSPTVYPRPAPLPVALTALIGRDREVAAARDLLARPDVRLVTLTGSGGIGKTRLATEIAHAESGAFGDGVVFVPLAPVTDADRVLDVIAQAVGIAEVGGAAETLTWWLRGSSLLLVLDNFEHVTAAAPRLTELLAACPNIKMLVTSRALLRVSGEFALPVTPLALPHRRSGTGLAEFERSPAVQLFVARARAIAADFRLSEANGADIAEICRQLDGVPLAIELAAAQSSVLNPAELLARIDAHLPLPVSGPRDAPKRLRSMHDAIAWSYTYLTVDEQALLRTLGVFHDGFTLEAVEAVCRAVPINGVDTLHAVSALVDKSLVQRAAGRFTTLETIRTFALDELRNSVDAERVAAAHAGYFLELAERIDRGGLSVGSTSHLLQLTADYPNLRAALVWYQAAGDGERLLRLTSALIEFWFACNLLTEGLDWMETALAMAPEENSSALGRVMAEVGRYLVLRGDSSRARELVDRAAEIAHRSGNPVTIPHVLIRQGIVLNRVGACEEAEAVLREALAFVEAHHPGDARYQAMITGGILANIATSRGLRGDTAAAVEFAKQSLALSRSANYAPGIVRALRDLGEISRSFGAYEESIGYFRECLERFDNYPSRSVLGVVPASLAAIASAWRQPVRAARLLGAAEQFLGDFGGVFGQSLEQSHFEDVRAEIGAGAGLDAARAAGRSLSRAGIIEEIDALLASHAREKAPAAAAMRLSPREQQVLTLLALEKSDREIADELFLSVRTVEAHVSHILTKLGVRTRGDAVAAAASAGLLVRANLV